MQQFKNIEMVSDLDLNPMTLVAIFDLDIMMTYLHVKMKSAD